MVCSSCQSEIDSGTRVCKTCGHPVSDNPTLEDIYFSRLAANAPPKLVKKVRTAPYLAKERRTVTAIMFTIANLDAFEQHIPEDKRNPILNQALDRFAKVIFEYEGTIAKLWENTVLAFFGAPVTHEDDPLRAVYAAASILDEVQEYSKEIEQSYDVPLKLNMVLNTGPVMIGDVKSNLRFSFQSLNNTLECVDSAIRAAIPSCEIVLCEDTYQFVKPFVECTKLDEISLTDINPTSYLFRVDRFIKHTLTPQRLSGTQQSALIGRQNELDLLLELSETVLAGLGRVGLILGEPGIGKSRLVLEWKRKMKTLRQPTQVRWIEAHGLAFGRELAYHLLKDLLRAILEITATTPLEKVKQILHTTLENNPEENQENHYLYLAHLLEIPLSDEEEEQIHQLNSSELRARYLHAAKSLIRQFTAQGPLIIILEDLHWADASSINIIVDLLSLTSTLPILFCMVSRQERDSDGWRLITSAREKFGPRMTRITLENLNERESEALVEQIIEIDQIPADIRSLVLGKSEGNPYFIEELVRMMINEGILEKTNNHWVTASVIDQNKIPDSLQGLLTGRIDLLPPDARLTLRVASVIGRVFPERVIEIVMAEHAPGVELLEQLSTLESIGMVKVAQVNPELTYKFAHILLHDAAYHSIVDVDRSQLHFSVGKALEELYPEQKERLASQLAHHFLESKQNEKAFQYLDLAGHVSMEAFAHTESESYFRKALLLTENNEQLAHLYTDLGEALAQQAKHRDAIKAWKSAIQHHAELGNSDRLARVYAWSARSAWWGYDPKHSLQICLDGLRAVEGAVESPDIAYLIHETGRAYLFNDQPEKALAYSEQALDMAKRLNAFDVQAEALATIGILPTVKPDQAIAALEMAVKISESNNLFGPAARAYINLAAVIDNLGEVRLARDYRKRAIQLGKKAGGVADESLIHQAIAKAALWLADFEDAELLIQQMRQHSRQKDAYLDDSTLNLLFLEGTLSRFKGDFNNAIEIFSDLGDRSRQTHHADRIKQANRALAEVIVESYLLEEHKSNRVNIDIALNLLEDAAKENSNSENSHDVETYCLLSNIYALMHNIDSADANLKAANDLYHKHPVMEDRVKIVLAQARLESAQNNYKKAFDYLRDSVEIFEKMDARWWRARIWLEIGNLHLKRNEPEDIDQAQNYFRESLAEFKEMGTNYYPDMIIDKLRQVKHVSRAQAIAHRKVNQELAEAGRVQNTFIPTQSPTIPGYQISGVLLPAHETSGDFYDFIELQDGNLGVVIADVGDKGAGAALYMAMSRTLIRTYAGESQLKPEKVIHEVNRRILTDTQRGIFLTLVFGVLNPTQGTFTYVNAGHNPPLLIKKPDQKMTISRLEKTGSLIGIFSENTWKTKTIKIKPGDVLILYTDGITEAQNETDDFYGNDRLIQSLKSGFDPSTTTFRNNILENVQAFMGSAPRLDDITLIVISRDADILKD